MLYLGIDPHRKQSTVGVRKAGDVALRRPAVLHRVDAALRLARSGVALHPGGGQSFRLEGRAGTEHRTCHLRLGRMESERSGLAHLAIQEKARYGPDRHQGSEDRQLLERWPHEGPNDVGADHVLQTQQEVEAEMLAHEVWILVGGGSRKPSEFLRGTARRATPARPETITTTPMAPMPKDTVLTISMIAPVSPPPDLFHCSLRLCAPDVI